LPEAEDLLSLCAFLAPYDLPVRLLTDHPYILPGPLAAAVTDPLGFKGLLGGVRRYSLATVTPEAVSVHRLVQAVVRHALEPEQATMWAAAAALLVAAGRGWLP
jgi:hypothetical protein